jgi:hypothetical protein
MLAIRFSSCLAAAILAGSSAAAQTADHLECYKVRDSLKATYTADLAGLVPEPGCTITAPAKLVCVASTKTNVSPVPPGGGGTGTPNRFLCYRARCPGRELPSIDATDQFGTRTVMPVVSKLLCAPLESSTGSTTSTTLSPCPAPGIAVGVHCWYGGIANESCDTVCANHGLAYDPATAEYAGSSGSEENCMAVLAGLYPGLPWGASMDCTVAGVGCGVLIPFGMGFRCVTPPTTSSAVHSEWARACACN